MTAVASRSVSAAEPAIAGSAAPAAEPSPVTALLRLEGEARGAANRTELIHLMANETRKVVKARQIFVLRRFSRHQWQIAGGTGLTAADRHVPLLQGVEQLMHQALREHAGAQAHLEFKLAAYTPGNEAIRTYAYQEALWVPLRDRRGDAFLGLLLLRDEPWKSADVALGKRLAGTYAQAWYWLGARTPLAPRWPMRRLLTAGVGAALMLLGAVPVPLTTLAPFEVVPNDPVLITAPMDGVIDAVPVNASDRVAAGAELARFVDQTLRNTLDVAEREAAVAKARLERTSMLAMNDTQARQELALARAELEVKLAERDHARAMLSRTVVRAPEPGTVMIGDRRELIGRPVRTGEKLLTLARTDHVEVRVDVPVGDAITLAPGGPVRLFLDTDPLAPRDAAIVRADYEARPTAAGPLAFRVIAKLSDTTVPPRLGARGSAQLSGDTVSLAYFLFRRPMAALRQWIGL